MRFSVRRRGVALVAALSLLALLGLIIVGAVAASSISQRAIHQSLGDAPLLGAAEYAAAAVLSDPHAFGLADLPLQRVHVFDVTIPSSDLKARVSVTRLPFGAYWLVGEAGNAEAQRRRIALIARTNWIAKPPSSPFVARGSTQLAADVIVLTDSAGEPDCTTSVIPPPLQTADSTLLFDAPGQWSALAGAPNVSRTAGDTTLTGGSFDGILMVSGDLTIAGAFEATGLIVARGRVRSTAGFHLTGALMSQSSAPVSIDLHGATVRYAPCLVNSLLRRVSGVETLHTWSWTELF